MQNIKAKFDRTLGDIPERVQKLFNEMMRLSFTRLIPAQEPFGWTPEADLYETHDEIVIRLNVAGVKKEDIEVSFHGNALKVSGRRLSPFEGSKPDRFFLLEMGSGVFERVFRLSRIIEENSIDASLADGILTVRMRRQTRPPMKHVEIKE